MRYVILLFASFALTAIALIAVGRSREQLHNGKVPLHSGLFESCATEIPKQPRPHLVMLYQLPPGTVQHYLHDEVPMRRDLGIEFVCTERCDPAKIRIRNRTALGSNFYYVFYNPHPAVL